MNANELLARITFGRALLIGILLAIFYRFALFDTGATQTASIQSTQSRIADLQKQVQESQRKLDRAMVYKKTAAEVGGTITKLLSLIPEKFAMPDLMRIVSNEAKTAGSSLQDIKPETTEVSKVASEFEEVSLTIDLSGTFLQHMVFLSNLTKMNQILIIRKFDFQLTRDAKGEDPALVKMAAKIVAYRYRGEELKSAKPGAPGAPGAKPPTPGGGK